MTATLTPPLSQLFTTGEVAASFNVDPTTVRYWNTVGLKIKGVRVKLAASGGVGGRRRYTSEDVESFRRAIAPPD